MSFQAAVDNNVRADATPHFNPRNHVETPLNVFKHTYAEVRPRYAMKHWCDQARIILKTSVKTAEVLTGHLSLPFMQDQFSNQSAVGATTHTAAVLMDVKWMESLFNLRDRLNQVMQPHSSSCMRESTIRCHFHMRACCPASANVSSLAHRAFTRDPAAAASGCRR